MGVGHLVDMTEGMGHMENAQLVPEEMMPRSQGELKGILGKVSNGLRSKIKGNLARLEHGP